MNSNQMRLPDALGIGFRRCASSWLHACLSEHPLIGKPPGGVHYFSDHLNKGDNWYIQQFRQFSEKRTVIDFSVSYAYPENIDQLIEHMPRILPGAKLFAIVRNPVERAFSDYRRSMFKEDFPPGTTFEEALAESPALLQRGRYGYILEKLLTSIPEIRFQVLFYDDVVSCPDKLWQVICKFLGVSSSFIPGNLKISRGHLAQPRYPRIHSLLRTVNSKITAASNRLGLSRHLHSLKRTRLWHDLVALSIRHREKDIQEATRKWLVDYYTEDILFLQQLTKRDLSGWLE